MRKSWILLVVALSGAGVGCAARTAGPVPAPAATRELSGPWVLTLALDGGMEFAVKLDLEARDERHFEAYSRRGAAGEFVSWPVALLGRLLGRMPPRGAVLYMRDGVATHGEDGVHVHGTLESPIIGRHYLTGVLSGGRLTGALRRDTLAAATGRFAAEPHPRHHAARDYVALAGRVEALVDSTIYDPELPRQSEWRAFFRDFGGRMARARDDADAMVAFYAARPRVRTSHFDLFRNPEIGATPLEELLAGGDDPASLVTLDFAGGVAVLRVSAWNDVAAAVGRAFERIDSTGSHTLVLDIRGNQGGDVSSAAPAAHLLRDSTYIGVFLGRGWFAQHRRAPTQAQLAAIPVLDGESSLSLLLAVREHGAVRGIVPPRAPHFAGPVYLLIDSNSASASEPLAQLLLETGRAVLIGERTAGAMLSAPPIAVGEGWVLRVPVADYFAASGARLEGAGVRPHVRVRGAEALMSVASEVAAADPFAAAVLRGRVHTQHARWPEAEHAWAEAVRLGGGAGEAGLGLGRALAEQQRWAEAFAQYEAMIAAHPGDLGAAYQIGRAAALSGTRLDLGERMLRRYLTSVPRPDQPSHASAYWRLGEILAALGRPADAATAWHAALALEPGHAGARAALAGLEGAGTRPPTSSRTRAPTRRHRRFRVRHSGRHLEPERPRRVVADGQLQHRCSNQRTQRQHPGGPVPDRHERPSA